MVSPISGGNLIPSTPLNPAPPVTGALSDSSIEQLNQSLVTDFSSQPRLSISQYHFGVSEAVRLNQVADIISRFEDGEVRRAMFLEAITQAALVAELYAKAVEYNKLQREYLALGATSLIPTLLQLQSAGTTVSSTVASSSAYTNLNTAIANYNAALSNYTTGLSTYTTALNQFNTAVGVYEPALQTWNTALETYNAIASPTPADTATLFTAGLTFQLAKDDFDAANSNFSATTSAMSNLQSQLDAAKMVLQASESVYDAFLGSISTIISQYESAVQAWNTAITPANALLGQMNLIGEELGLDPHPLNDFASATTFTFDLPAEVGIPAKDTALSAYNDLQTTITPINTLISVTLNPNITAANADFSSPLFAIVFPIQNPSVLSSSTTEFPTVAPFTPSIVLPTIATFAPFDPTINIPALTSLAELANRIAAINAQDDSTNDSPFALINRRASTEVTTGGSGSSTQLTNISPLAQAQNPFLNSTLSQQAFESIFNIYGVPAGSALVDQLSAAISTLTEASGVLSTPLAQDLISTSSVNANSQDTGVRFILSLANLTGLSTLIQDGTLRASLAQIMREDASFQALQSEQQDALLDALTQEVGATLLKAALAYISQQFGMPGLIPQLLVAAAGVGDGDALGSIQSQLFFSTTLADQLQANLGISSDLANQVANQAVASGGDDDVAIQQSVSQSISDQGLSTLSEDEVNNQIGQSIAEARDVVNDTVATQEQAQKQAFADSLTSSLLGQGILDQTQASRITQELLNATLDQVDEIALRILREFNLDQEELQQILAEADQAKNALDASANPIAALNATAEATPTSLQTGFEELARQVLAPAVGDAQALQIAGDYGRLIFSSPNSILARLQANEGSLRTQASYDYSARLADDYQTYTADLRNPTTATGNPLQLGETLLLSANMGGPSTAGVTSLDNQLGVFGNTHINPSGILG